jgi:quinol monooxygenase YgiN
MSHLEVVARMKIRQGQLEAFKSQAAELLRLTRERDTQTLRYDSFINEATMECEVHEAYLNEQGFMEHNQHIMQAREVLFHEYADDHRICVFGEVSPQLMQFLDKFGGVVTVFPFLIGLELSPAV